MNKAKFWIPLTVVAAIGVSLLLLNNPGPNGTKGGGQQGRSIRIGAIYPLTGPASSFGQAFSRGVELAVEAQSRPGSSIELHMEDSKSSPKGGIAAYQKLRSENVKLMLTTISSIALAIEPLARQDQVLLFADVAYPGITKGKPLLFRHSSTAEQEARVIFEHLAAKAAASSIGVMWINDDYGAAFKRQIEGLAQQGHATLHLASYERTANDVRAEAAKLLDAGVKTVVVVGYGKAMGLAIRRLREAGFKGEILANVGLTLTPAAAAAAGEAAHGVRYTHIDIDESDPDYQLFANRYEKKHGAKPPSFAALSYNSALLLIDAARKHAGDPQATARDLLARGTYRGAGEKMTITPTGDILPPMDMKTYAKQ